MKLKKSGLGGVGAGVALFVVGLGIIPLAYCQDNNPEHTGNMQSEQAQPTIINHNTNSVPMDSDAVGPAGNNPIQLNNIQQPQQQYPQYGSEPANTAVRQDSLGGLINQIESGSAQSQAANDQHLTNQPISNPTTGKRYPTGECNPDALAVGIQHFRYDNARASDLVNIGSRKLHRDAAASLKEMQAAAKRDGVTLTVGSAYRSINYQKGIINRKKSRGMSDKTIYSASAPAGYSEHSTGYVVDFTPIESSFGNTRAYRWLKQNAHKYHWVQSFTPESTRVSNVMIEPWHWRYEGTPEAKQLFAPRSCYR